MKQEDIDKIAERIKKEKGWVNFLGSVKRNLKEIMPIIEEHFEEEQRAKN